MKSILVGIAALSAFVITGCTQKTPMVEHVEQSSINKIDTNSLPEETNIDIVDTNSMSSEDLISSIKSQLGVVYFGFDEYSVSSSMQKVILDDAKIFKGANASKMAIKVQGNCDEWGTDEYNMALGLKRAQSVKNALIAHGVDEKNLNVISYGKNDPVCSDKTKECWAKNRRVDFDLIP